MLQQRILQKEIDELPIMAGYGTSRYMARNISGTDRRCRDVEHYSGSNGALYTLKKYLAQQSAIECDIINAIYVIPGKVFSLSFRCDT